MHLYYLSTVTDSHRLEHDVIVAVVVDVVVIIIIANVVGVVY